MYKAHTCLATTFGGSDLEKAHAVVARSTFPSQNVQSTSFSDHFWKLRCRKSARRCGAKHISKSKCTKHTPCLATTFGSWDVEKVHAVVARSAFPSQNVQNTPFSDHFLEVEMSKKCKAVVVRSTCRSQNVQSTTCSRHFWRFRSRKSARRCGAKHISKSKCTKHHSRTTFGSSRCRKKCTPLWREAHFEVKMYRCRFASLRVITLHYTLHYTTVHYTTLHSTTPQLQLQNYTTLHYTTLHYTIHSTTLHYTTLHYTIQSTHYSTLHYTPQHYNYNYRTTQLHSTTLHYTPLH